MVNKDLPYNYLSLTPRGTFKLYFLITFNFLNTNFQTSKLSKPIFKQIIF